MTETDEDAIHRIAIECLVAVEDENKSSELRSKSFDRLSLTGAGWAKRRATHAPVHCLSESEIAAICQRSLNKLLRNSHVLETIEELTVGHANIQLLKHFLMARIEVESHVVQPVELVGCVDFLSNQLLSNFALMD